jgi:3',5'-cyclic-AMP phosphodiesterase
MIVLAQFSDTHLNGRQDRAQRAAAVVAYLNGLDVTLDAVLVTGDIADHGLPGEYEQARAIWSSSRHPVLSCPGNHDARAAFRRVLLGEAVDVDAGAPVNRVHRAAGAVFALCDSTIPGRDGGRLADETLRWLDNVLAERPEVPSFVCFHHPPVPLHSHTDDIHQSGADRLAALLAGHPQVAAILCGHAHIPVATSFAGRPLLVAPGIASTLALPWERSDAADEQAPTMVALHALDDQHRLTTHYRVVPGTGAVAANQAPARHA